MAERTGPPIDPDTEVYLGDGVMVGHDGYQVWLYLAPGHEPRDARNGIALEPGALARFEKFIENVYEEEPEEPTHD